MMLVEGLGELLRLPLVEDFGGTLRVVLVGGLVFGVCGRIFFQRVRRQIVLYFYESVQKASVACLFLEGLFSP